MAAVVRTAPSSCSSLKIEVLKVEASGRTRMLLCLLVTYDAMMFRQVLPSGAEIYTDCSA